MSWYGSVRCYTRVSSAHFVVPATSFFVLFASDVSQVIQAHCGLIRKREYLGRVRSVLRACIEDYELIDIGVICSEASTYNSDAVYVAVP
jgi:hypothetical protein